MTAVLIIAVTLAVIALLGALATIAGALDRIAIAVDELRTLERARYAAEARILGHPDHHPAEDPHR